MKLTVYKFDPATDAEPYYVSGEIPFSDHMTGLHAIMRFDEQVAHVNYDHSCRARACGRCAMMLDGKPTLMCTEFLTDEDHTIEPLKGFRVMEAVNCGLYRCIQYGTCDAVCASSDIEHLGLAGPARRRRGARHQAELRVLPVCLIPLMTFSPLSGALRGPPRGAPQSDAYSQASRLAISRAAWRPEPMASAMLPPTL